MVCPLVLTSFIWLIVYTYLCISIVPPPPLDLPRQQQEERPQRSRPDHRRSHQHRISLLPPHSSVRFNVNQTQPPSPVHPSSSIRLSTLTMVLISLNPIPPIECEHSYHHIHLTSDRPSSQTQPRITYITKRFRRFVHRHLLTSNNKAHTFLGVFLTYKESSSSSDTLDVLSRKLSYQTKWRRRFGLS